jgi:hypothetical protein
MTNRAGSLAPAFPQNELHNAGSKHGRLMEQPRMTLNSFLTPSTGPRLTAQIVS